MILDDTCRRLLHFIDHIIIVIRDISTRVQLRHTHENDG